MGTHGLLCSQIPLEIYFEDIATSALCIATTMIILSGFLHTGASMLADVWIYALGLCDIMQKLQQLQLQQWVLSVIFVC